MLNCSKFMDYYSICIASVILFINSVIFTLFIFSIKTFCTIWTWRQIWCVVSILGTFGSSFLLYSWLKHLFSLFDSLLANYFWEREGDHLGFDFTSTDKSIELQIYFPKMGNGNPLLMAFCPLVTPACILNRQNQRRYKELGIWTGT